MASKPAWELSWVITECCCSITKSCPTLCDPMDYSLPSSSSLLKFMSIKSVMLSNHFIFCCSLLLLSSVFPSIKVFSNGSALCIFLSQPACQLATIFFQSLSVRDIGRNGQQISSWRLPKLCVEKDSQVMSVLRLSRKEYCHWLVMCD